jgi:hypothetical protein
VISAAVPRPNANSTTVVALGFVAVSVFAILFLMANTPFETWGALLVVPPLILVMLPAFRRQANREEDPTVFKFLLIMLIIKFVGTVVRFYVAFEVYEKADATVYDGWGVFLSREFRQGSFVTYLPTLTDTNFIRLLTGIIYTVIGPTQLGGFMVFSWFGFIGLYFFYRAFVLAVPEGNARRYGRLLFLMPTLVFWPSSIGKEGWALLGIGLASYGVARILTGTPLRGMLCTFVALWLVGIIRPHIAALVAIAAVLVALIRKPVRPSVLAPIGKVVILGAALVGASMFVGQAEEFLQYSGVPTDQGISQALGTLSERTSIGHSQFSASVATSPILAPVAAITVLFRPFLFEAHNAQAMATAVEASFLLGFTILRFRWIMAALRSMRRQPYVAFAMFHVILFIVGFSGVANFGLLARQRVQVYPLFLILLAIPPVISNRRESTRRTPSEPTLETE